MKRPIALFGTFGWGGGGIFKLRKMIEAMRCEVLEPVVRVRGRANEQEIEDCKKLAHVIADRLK
jgi:flavorubredoxin